MDTAIETETADTEEATGFEMPAIEDDLFLKDIVPGTMSGAEALAYWKANGVFDVPWPQHEGIGEGKKYADSTEYVQGMRARADYRGH